ncbi:MAG: hypothetical protein V3T72_14585 [Thermoanaerobaculia bacterium]
MPHQTIRHVLATLAYRSRQVIKEVPDGYANFDAGSGVRTPVEILHHMSTLLAYAEHTFHDGEWQPLEPISWDLEKQRFESALKRLDRRLADGDEPRRGTLLPMLQGPISDAMTHVGQLATLRRMAGSPVPGESFVKAPIEAGRLDVT